MNSIQVGCLILILSELCACQKRTSSNFDLKNSVNQKPIVMVFTLDGLGFDILKSVPEGEAFIQENKVERLIPPVPAVTFPSHATMIFGTDPEVHGVLKNFSTSEEFSNPLEAIMPRSNPQWESLKAKSVKLQLSGMADLNQYGDIPALPVEPFAAVSSKFDVIMQKIKDGEYQDATISFVWSEGTDKAGHAYGPEAQETKERLQVLLRDLQLIKDKIAKLDVAILERVSFVFASDHGMAKLKTCTPYLSKRESEDFLHGASYVLLKTEKAVKLAKALQAEALPEATIKLYSNPQMLVKGVLLLPEGYKFNNAGQNCELFALGNHEFDPEKYSSQHGVFWDWSKSDKRPPFPTHHVDVLKYVSALIEAKQK